MPENDLDSIKHSTEQPLYSLPKDKLFSVLQTQETGLSDEEASARLTKYGLNKLSAKNKISPLKLYIGQFKNTLTLILLGAVVLLLFIYFFGEREQSDLIEAGLIFSIVIMVTFLGFFQEFKAEKAIESLKKLLAFKARVLRNGVEKEVEVAELVPGDIVVLDEGSKVPADIRLLQIYSLSVIEAALTGESVPAMKTVNEIEGEKQLSDQKNMVFSGTTIASGRGMGVVMRTGDNTEIGKIAQYVAQSDEDETPIQKRLDGIGKIIGTIIVTVCALIFVFIMFFAQEFAEQDLLLRIIHSFIAAVALAVAAIPEGLPAAVTIALALGTQRMLKKNVLVRKLSSVETLGSTDIICSDKTGTLTKGEMTVTQIYFDNEIYEVTGTGYEMNGEFLKKDKKIEQLPFDSLLFAGLICNNASFDKEGKVLGDPTEAALIVSAKKANVEDIPADMVDKTPESMSNLKNSRVAEIPFNSERKRMSVVIKVRDDKYIVYVKGATEKVLQNCKFIKTRHGTNDLKDDERKKILQANSDLSSQALRNLGFAYKLLDKHGYESQKDKEDLLENDLIFLGIQGMIDPPRAEVAPLITQCNSSGIRVIMITGDHENTAKAVAKDIGIVGDCLSGDELDRMSDEEFVNTVESISVYARVNPGAKMRIVDALKKKGHVVAMTGDGVNDAPALKKADIGIAMGITGTDVAKEASDMVLMDDKFSSIIAAVEEGRGIFHNIRKFVVYLLSCNIAEVIIIFVGVVLFQKLPLSPIMLLWVNLVTDGLPAVALSFDHPERGIMKYSPKVFQSQIIDKKMMLEMAVFGVLLAGQVLIIFSLNLGAGEQTAQSAAFFALVVFELVNLYIVRSVYKVPIYSNKWLLISISVTLSLQILIFSAPFLHNLFEISPINWSDFAYIAIATIWLWLVFKVIKLFLK